jgi:hypothetical protein
MLITRHAFVRESDLTNTYTRIPPEEALQVSSAARGIFERMLIGLIKPESEPSEVYYTYDMQRQGYWGMFKIQAPERKWSKSVFIRQRLKRLEII